MNFTAPYVDIRIPVVEITVGELRREFPATLMLIHLHPFASGPEVELIFGTPEGAEPCSLEVIVSAVEKAGITVLASRERKPESISPVSQMDPTLRGGLH